MGVCERLVVSVHGLTMMIGLIGSDDMKMKIEKLFNEESCGWDELRGESRPRDDDQ